MEEHSAHESEQVRAAALQRALVEDLKARGLIQSPAVAAAFSSVPRHLFLPDTPLDIVYRDQVVPLKIVDGVCISSSSQPAIMAVMLEQLDLQPGQRVLEIGAASGYNAALMAHIVGERGQVVTMDIDEDLAEGARAHLQAAGYERVRVVCGDGALGYAAEAPYDRIVLTVASGDIAAAWYRQLRPGGRLLLPLSLRDAQFSVALEARGSYLESISVRCCAFMMLRGPFAEAGGIFSLRPGSGLQLRLNHYQALDPGLLYRKLSGPWYDLPCGVMATLHEIHSAFNSWLSQQDPAACTLLAHQEQEEIKSLPWLFKLFGLEARATIGLVEANQICLLATPQEGRELTLDKNTVNQPCELLVRCFAGDEHLARRLLGHVRSWNASGRPAGWYLLPGDERVRIRVYPLEVACPEQPGRNRQIFTRRWSRLVIEHHA
jgi:protein-L-isoaspartate(D-aspartate) O-methyltransferase